MSTTSAGERKRTVTVTVGPITWEVMEQVRAAAGRSLLAGQVTPTAVAGAAMRRGLEEMVRALGGVAPGGWDFSYD